ASAEPVPASGGSAANPDWAWLPRHADADRTLASHYTDASDVVGLYLHQHLQQQPGMELVQTGEPWRPDADSWRVLSRTSVPVMLGKSGAVQVREATVKSAQQRLLVWSWYRVDGKNTDNTYLVKLWEARQQISEGRREGTRLFLATPVKEGGAEQARERLQAFIGQHQAAIEQALDRRDPVTSP
ncbi:MAG: exosortase C-terminal domain/associated protein EpsI, partial [Halioglobus sp.]